MQTGAFHADETRGGRPERQLPNRQHDGEPRECRHESCPGSAERIHTTVITVTIDSVEIITTVYVAADLPEHGRRVVP
jgi:hypothetical protein